MEINDLIKEIRQELCYSQADLAKALNVSEQTIRRWEHGQSKPRYASMRKLKILCDTMQLKLHSRS